MTDIELYNSAYGFVLNLPGITEVDLKKHLQIDSASNRPKDIRLLRRRVSDINGSQPMSGQQSLRFICIWWPTRRQS
jgi:hypothetical protein